MTDLFLKDYRLIIIIMFISIQIITAFFTSWIANKKDYDNIIWFFLGLFFGSIAFFAISFAPDNNIKDYLRRLLMFEKIKMIEQDFFLPEQNVFKNYSIDEAFKVTHRKLDTKHKELNI